MKITLMQQIQLKENIRHYKNVDKEFESNVIPHKGDFICDPAFKDPYEYEVVEVIINYENDECYVRLAPNIINSTDPEHIEDEAKIMKLHGWSYLEIK